MQNLVEVESHSTLLESHCEQSYGSTCPGYEPEVALQRNPAHTSLHTIKKASYLLVILLQGGVTNKLALPPICSFRWYAHAPVCSLRLGSFGGGQWECCYGEGGESED